MPFKILLKVGSKGNISQSHRSDAAQGVSRVRVGSHRCLPARCVQGLANSRLPRPLVARPFLGDGKRPAVLLMNHTSFLDAVQPPQRVSSRRSILRLAVSMGPLRRCADVRVLVANYVMSSADIATGAKRRSLRFPCWAQ